jgi:peptidoglycan hydrolase CwlO-like protein
MADLATLQSRLDAAETALHNLQIGALEMQVDHADMRVAYTKADIGKLQGYIDSLKTQIAAAGGTITGQRRRGLDVNL